MNINGYEVEINLLDADFIERYEKGCEKIKNLSTEKPQEMKMSEWIRQECQVVRDFFDETCGEGTAQKIFGNKYDFMACLLAFQQITDKKIRQQEDIEKALNKYSPDRLK